ncbi:hypothetical protein PS467_12780 [Streptomyces luomodiensis]|uniref:Uncharacterized protein n=1 Tax=Streptomyces luomodiensis TaxID=3026192 RepID=A0ABY9UUN2_9ACTN|nr:hypothetical protein [Streptomyces sp. SCA4-21]WNE96151.1 hypothetical protein PS467_12780 [Streptomyces sp. SCA4-21]
MITAVVFPGEDAPMTTAVDRLASQLEALPGADDPWFPPALNDLVFRTSEVRRSLDAIVCDDTRPLTTRFKAFYGYLNHARRSLDISAYDRYHDRHANLFSAFRMAPLLRSQRFLNHLQAGERSNEFAVAAKRFADVAKSQLPDHFGVQAHWATVVATTQSLLPDASRDITLLREAIEAQDLALLESDGRYPRFYATKAELLHLVQDWEAALAAIATAIDREDSTLADYPVRIGRYQALRAEIESERRLQAVFESSVAELHSLREQTAMVRKELEGLRNSTLTLVGLLAAIVAFITTSTSLASRLKIADAIHLIAVSSASMLVVFAGILWLVTGADNRAAAVRFLGVLVLAGLLWAVALIPA